MIYLIDLESVESRYTKEWKTHFPKILKEKTNHEVKVIDGPDLNTLGGEETTKGAFLNFAATNIYKAAQVDTLARMFHAGDVKNGDHFVFADAWHPGIINLKYMADLLKVNIKIHALWHAGSYDPHDFLGRTIDQTKAKKYVPWVRHIERGLFEAINHNYFASDFHIELFLNNLLDADTRAGRIRYMAGHKIVRTGWPMEYTQYSMLFSKKEKEDIIVFPHRIAPEKQPEIFRELKKEMPEYTFVFAQENNLKKEEYYDLLGRAKMVFSANLQETLGISCYEILEAGGIPLVPNRLSYTEMYDDSFKYPYDWTSSFSKFQKSKVNLVEKIKHMMNNFDKYGDKIEKNRDFLRENYFSCDKLCEVLK